MVLNIGVKFKRKLTCAFKSDMRNLANFLPEHVQKPKNWNFHWVVLSKAEIYELKIDRGVMCHDNEE